MINPKQSLKASQKVYLLPFGSPFVIATYFHGQLFPQDACALPQEFSTLPSDLMTFRDVIDRAALKILLKEMRLERYYAKPNHKATWDLLLCSGLDLSLRKLLY